MGFMRNEKEGCGDGHDVHPWGRLKVSVRVNMLKGILNSAVLI